MTDGYNAFEMEMEEPLPVRVERSSSKKCTVGSWLRRVVILDDAPNQQHYYPMFIIIMSILHISIYLLTYINISWKGQSFASSLYDLGKLFLPCMRPASHDVRARIVRCKPMITNRTCHYDDMVKNMCFSFTYPHQLWRMATVSLLHGNWLHLLSNLSAQLVQGIPLERKYGSGRVAAVYWLSGLGASLIFLLKLGTNSAIGASGCLYGMMLFLIVDRLNALQTNRNRRLFVLMQLVLLLLPYIVASIPQMIMGNVAHLGHIGGAFVGFLLGIGMCGCVWLWNNEHCIWGTTCRPLAFVLLSLYYVVFLAAFFLIDVPILETVLYNSVFSYQAVLNVAELEHN